MLFLLLCLPDWLTLSLIYTDTCFPSILRTHPEPKRKVHRLIRLSLSRTYSLDGHKDETPSSRSFIIACHFESDTVWLSHCVNHSLTSYNKGRWDKVHVNCTRQCLCNIKYWELLCICMRRCDSSSQEKFGNRAFYLIAISHIREKREREKWKCCNVFTHSKIVTTKAEIHK